MIDRTPRRQIVRQQFPSTAAVHGIEDAMENFAAAMLRRATAGFGRRHERDQLFPFGIGEVGIIRGARRIQFAG